MSAGHDHDHHESPHGHDESSHAHDESPHAHDGSPHAHDGSPHAHDESPHARGESQHLHDDLEESHDHLTHGLFGHVHQHAPPNSPRQYRALLFAVVLTGGFALVEALGGWWSGSLALLSDAGHMLSDTLALGLAALAGQLALRPPSARHSYGLVRAEVLAAAFNALLMLAVIIAISVESVQRLLHPAPVAGGAVMLIATLGLLVNVVTAFILARGGDGLNIRAALLHVMGDLLGSVAAIAAGAIIWFTGWLPADPILSLLVALTILASTLRLLSEATHVLMEGVPHALDLQMIGKGMVLQKGILGVHDLHIWTLASGQTALSAHIEIERIEGWPLVLHALRRYLARQHGIDHVTLQPECRLPMPSLSRPHIPIRLAPPSKGVPLPGP